MQCQERVHDALSVWRPQPHDTNLVEKKEVKTVDNREARSLGQQKNIDQ